MRFVETSVFTRRIIDALSDDEYRLLQEALLRRPAQGDLIEEPVVFESCDGEKKVAGNVAGFGSSTTGMPSGRSS